MGGNIVNVLTPPFPGSWFMPGPPGRVGASGGALLGPEETGPTPPPPALPPVSRCPPSVGPRGLWGAVGGGVLCCFGCAGPRRRACPRLCPAFASRLVPASRGGGVVWGFGDGPGVV